MSLKAVIFDLDGVLTDTAELHYKSWVRLMAEEEMPFSRERNEQLRGATRYQSLALLFAGHVVSPEQQAELLERKNRYFFDLLEEARLLPGIAPLLAELKAAGIPLAVGSASQNARPVLEVLGVTAHFAAILDGTLGLPPKPAPDMFLVAAQALGVAPGNCVVVEDAERGIDAALAGGFATIGIGPAARVGHAHLRLGDTSGLTMAVLREALVKR
ncbi:MAG: beta-phosphoglucomutase family hydrolase [Ardenticatenales bacterium]|nr:beta-phosphoglucomutase family hydrolase [Ardenticatenales bacterium]